MQISMIDFACGALQKIRHQCQSLSPLLLVSLLSGLSIPAMAQNGNEAVTPISLYVNALGNNKVVGLTPAMVQRAYGFDLIANQGEGQTIGILASWDNPTIEADLSAFNAEFGLQSSAFAKLYYPSNTVPVPPAGYPSSVLEEFQLESSLDVEWA